MANVFWCAYGNCNEKYDAVTKDERADVIEECVRIALEKAIKLEIGEITENGSRLNPTAYQWRTIANELRELAKQ